MLNERVLAGLMKNAQLTSVVHSDGSKNVLKTQLKDLLKSCRQLELFPVDASLDCYDVVAVDGSQIYPDRHMPGKGDVALINIGGLAISYGQKTSKADFFSTPELVVRDGQMLTPELIDMKRDIKELEILAQKMVPGAVGLRDGTLSLGHLAAGPKKYAEQFLADWQIGLDQMCQKKQLLASYMSAPRTSDLIKTISPDVPNNDIKKMLNNVTDVDLLEAIHDGSTVRTGVFACKEPLSQSLPERLRPSFFYLFVGSEWACIQIPGWIAANPEAIETIVRVCANQCAKGQGYPVVLAEAHEQAVIRGNDRDLFYKMIESADQSIQHSQKAYHKQSMPV